jgi:hypothetical protein
VISEERFVEALRIALEAVKAEVDRTQADFTLSSDNPDRSPRG